MPEDIKARIAQLMPFFHKYSLGDFSEKIEIPEKEDELTELLVGLNLMIDDFQELLTSQKQAETELKKAQAFSRVGSWEWDIKSGQVKWSDEMYRLFGLKKEGVKVDMNKVIGAAIHPDDRQKVEASNRSVIKNKKPIPIEYRVIWPDKSVHIIWAEAGELILDEQGNPSILRGYAQDISERRRAETLLLESEQKYRSIIDSVPIGMHMYELKPDGKLVFIGANPTADKILGIENSQFIGKTIEDAFPPLKETEVPQRYREVAKTGTPWSTEQINYEHGKIKGAFEVHAFQTSANRMAAAFTEITERKQAKEEMDKRVSDLERFSKVAMGREDRILELKKEVERLKEKLGEA